MPLQFRVTFDQLTRRSTGRPVKNIEVCVIVTADHALHSFKVARAKVRRAFPEYAPSNVALSQRLQDCAKEVLSSERCQEAEAAMKKF